MFRSPWFIPIACVAALTPLATFVVFQTGSPIFDSIRRSHPQSPSVSTTPIVVVVKEQIISPPIPKPTGDLAPSSTLGISRQAIIARFNHRFLGSLKFKRSEDPVGDEGVSYDRDTSLLLGGRGDDVQYIVITIRIQDALDAPSRPRLSRGHYYVYSVLQFLFGDDEPISEPLRRCAYEMRSVEFRHQGRSIKYRIDPARKIETVSISLE